MIQTRYDPKAEALHVKFGPDGAKYDGADEAAPGVLVEFDPDGNASALRSRATVACGQQMRHPGKGRC